MRTTSAMAAAACPAAGRYARHRATVRWHRGGIAMRRAGTIVAPGALLSMFKGAGAACLHTRHSPRREWSLMLGTAVTRQLTGRARLVLIILAALIGSGAPALTATAAATLALPATSYASSGTVTNSGAVTA